MIRDAGCELRDAGCELRDAGCGIAEDPPRLPDFAMTLRRARKSRRYR
jgi:hypothetical protein